MNKATFNTGGQGKAMNRAREIIGGREEILDQRMIIEGIRGSKKVPERARRKWRRKVST